MVASHNDYPTKDGARTYWSFSKGREFIDGDGKTDQEALERCLEISWPKTTKFLSIYTKSSL